MNNDVIFTDKEGCGPPPVIDFATHNEQELDPGVRYPSGTMLQYSCIEGYMKGADNVERAWCIVGGMWVGPKIVCRGKDVVQITIEYNLSLRSI